MLDAATREIRCPLCRKGLRLEGFEIDVHADGTFSADPIVECSHDPCPAYFAINHSRAFFRTKPQLSVPTRKRR